MVDEYQDANYLQYKLIHALWRKEYNLCVVGDDDQYSISGEVQILGNILDFEGIFCKNQGHQTRAELGPMPTY